MEFIKEIFEARMTKDDGSSQKLTYTDCGERLYLILLALEMMNQYPDFKLFIQNYCKKTVGFELYKFYRIMGTDLYNFIYFLVGDDSAQRKLKEPDVAIAAKKSTRVPVRDLNRYLNELAQGKNPLLVSSLFIKLENSLRITNPTYKDIRRSLSDWGKLTIAEKQKAFTQLIFAVRAKLRSSDIIDDFEKFAALKNLETDRVVDTEPTISVPDILISPTDIALYRYIVGNNSLGLTKKFLELAKDGKGIPAPMVQAYLPAIALIDDIVKAGPAYVQNLRALHKRAKKKI